MRSMYTSQMEQSGRTRASWQSLPYKKIPMVMLVELISSSVFWLNNFPPTRGIGSLSSPCTLVTGLDVDFKKHCQLKYGKYVQTHEEHDNSLATWTIGAIALWPTGNEQGGWYFMILATGQGIICYSWTSFLMPKEVIARVNWLGDQSCLTQDLIFQFSNREMVNDDDSDDEYYITDDDHESDIEMDVNDWEPEGPLNAKFTGVDHQQMGPEEAHKVHKIPDSTEVGTEETHNSTRVGMQEAHERAGAPESTGLGQTDDPNSADMDEDGSALDGDNASTTTAMTSSTDSPDSDTGNEDLPPKTANNDNDGDDEDAGDDTSDSRSDSEGNL